MAMMPLYLNVVLSCLCLVTVYGESEDSQQLGCDREGKICYTLHTNEWLNQTAAEAECRHRHIQGRLVTILDNSTQTTLSHLLGNMDLEPAEYWTGATIKILDRWTWLNGYAYDDMSWSNFRNLSDERHGYAKVEKRGSSLLLSFVEFEDSPSDEMNALCMCQGCAYNERYSKIPARRWHEARNICRLQPGRDLAVLADRHAVNNVSVVMENGKRYFIGLSNVRIMWSSEGSDEAGNYTNWSDDDPASFDNNDICVGLSRDEERKWSTFDCDETKPFICEFAKPNFVSTNSFTTTQSTLEMDRSTSMKKTSDNSDSFTTAQSILEMDRSTPMKKTSDNSVALYVGLCALGLLIATAVVVIIIICLQRRSRKKWLLNSVPEHYVGVQRSTYRQTSHLDDVPSHSDSSDRLKLQSDGQSNGGANRVEQLQETPPCRHLPDVIGLITSSESAATVLEQDLSAADTIVYASIVPAAGPHHTSQMPAKTVDYASLDFR